MMLICLAMHSNGDIQTGTQRWSERSFWSSVTGDRWWLQSIKWELCSGQETTAMGRHQTESWVSSSTNSPRLALLAALTRAMQNSECPMRTLCANSSADLVSHPRECQFLQKTPFYESPPRSKASQPLEQVLQTFLPSVKEPIALELVEST